MPEAAAPAEEVDKILEEAVAELGADMPGVPAQEETEPVEEAVEEAGEVETEAPAEVEAPATPAPVAPVAPPAPAQTAAPATQAAEATRDDRFRVSKDLGERIAKNRQDVAALKSKIAKGEFSPVDDAGEAARLQLESVELRDALDGERENHTNTTRYWDNFGRSNPAIGAQGGQKLYNDAYAAVRARFPEWSDAQVAGGAAIAWENMVEKLKASPPAPKPNPTAPASPAAAKGKTIARTGFAPSGRTGAPKPKATKDPADEFGEFFAKNGGDLSELTGG